ncbi:MAG: sigma-70 family RNA polymerase sigma factor [Deltaproteobacteria bacterium]|nr:sigma-70 family RNA polymerase sigma factor [Deltaproteobacteria bacterium]
MKPTVPEANLSGDAPLSVNEQQKNASKQPLEAQKGHADQQLVQRVQTGDKEAFRQLFERYNRRVYAVAFSVVKNQQDALDIVQDAFIKVHKHIDTFQGTSSFYTWLYRIVMNLAIDHVRKLRRIIDFDDRVGLRSDASKEPLMPSMQDANPGKTVVRKELTKKINQALDALPEYHKAVILLREVEGLSYEEMSQILQVPKGTVMSRLFHARRKMQESLESYLDGDFEIEG